jgi:thimet oligopeptidase
MAPKGACQQCVLPPPPPLSDDLPPFVWPRTAAEIEGLAQGVEIDFTTTMDRVAAVKDEDASVETVLRPLMGAPHYKTNRAVVEAKFLQHCSTDASVRAAADKAGARFAALKAKGRTDPRIYGRVCALAAKNTVSGRDAHFTQSLKAGFERSGLNLSPADQQKLQSLRDQDAKVCGLFKKNLAEDKTELLFDKSELEGCSDAWIAERTRDGKVVVTLKYPDLIPVLQQCSVAATRRRVSRARECEAYGANLDYVAEGVSIRKQIADLLGYKSWAHLSTETRMSGSPEAVKAFMDPLLAKVKEGAARDLERLKGLKGGALEASDVSFYSAKLLKEQYGVDHEAVRAYFPLDHVVATTLEIYQELLGLEFVEIDKFDTWHPAVRLFRVIDVETKQKQGFFYLDLHPRDGKYGHAAIFHLLKRWGDQVPVDCMLCNLPAPSADGKPALLRHSNCVTFFHEFGHIMHGLCSAGDGNSTTLAKCPRDFVEAPSQMLENWCWTVEGLKRLSKHHETGATLPRDLLDKMLAAKNVNVGLNMARQIYLSTLDLEIHGTNPPTTAEGLQALVDRLRPEISLIENPEGANMLRSFGHLMNQCDSASQCVRRWRSGRRDSVGDPRCRRDVSTHRYSAAYYGYLWAEVLSADMFAQCFQKDPFDAKAGRRYRDLVLAPGGVGKILDHLTTFLGRPPSQEAFLKSRGIA